MRNPLKEFLNQYLYFSKRDRNAILILLFLIFISIVAVIVIKNIETKSKYDYFEFRKMVEEWEKRQLRHEDSGKYLFSFNPNTITLEKFDSLNIPRFIKQNIVNYRNAGGHFDSVEQIRKIYGMNDSIFEAIKYYVNLHQIHKNGKPKPQESDNKPTFTGSGYFDPNNVEMDTLLKFGFSQFQANNLIKYRASGGKFNVKSDILKIYGIDSAFFLVAENYIKIEKTPSDVSQPIKLIELNGADSLDLLELDGIGPVFAGRILKYKNLLGGYYSKLQLLEVYNFPPETFKKIENRIYADTLLLNKIRINYADYTQLLKHPYLNKKQTNELLTYRNKNGAFKNLEDVKKVFSSDSVTFRRLSPYLTCR